VCPGALVPPLVVLVPEPCELAYGTALLLSNSGISIGTVYTSRGSPGILHWNPYSSPTGTLIFLVLQVLEFGVLGVYTSDSYTGTIYISISGLHLIHVSGGLVLIGVQGGRGYGTGVAPGGQGVPGDIYYILDYYYWHLVEVVYIYIYILLYYYYYRYPPPVGGLYTGETPGNRYYAMVRYRGGMLLPGGGTV